MSWGRRDQSDLAVEELLDAAGELFAEHGIAASSMADVARAAGCSRATVYRYFANRDELRLAYVNREAVRVARAVGATVAGIDDPSERLAAAVLGSVDQVRRTPTLAAWFSTEEQGIASQLASSSDVVDALAAGLLGDEEHRAEERRAEEHRAAARWLVRVIVSLLSAPADPDEERALVERFVVPAVLADLDV